MVASVWPPDTVKDVAESIGINQLDDDVAKVLALDIEYRIHEVIQVVLCKKVFHILRAMFKN